MPGIKIGTNSLISAGIVVDCDIAENTFCYGKTELVLKKNER
jgi:acetyltransferase-like isoleucine patch superfamily enzyme